MFRFVRQQGNVSFAPNFVTAYASGTIQRGSVVEFNRTNNRVEPASSATTYTTVFGISLDYAEGASDTQVRVVPFAQGQLWQADCANAITTAQLFIRHALSNSLNLNNTATDSTSAKQIFLAHSVSRTLTIGAATISTLIGEFIRAPISGQL